jgi:hypothetical protein
MLTKTEIMFILYVLKWLREIPFMKQETGELDVLINKLTQMKGMRDIAGE